MTKQMTVALQGSAILGIALCLAMGATTTACKKDKDKETATKPDKPTSAKVTPAKLPDRAKKRARAVALAKKLIIVDGHVDLPYRLHKGKDEQGNLTEDPSEATDKGDFDFVRARAGGLDAPFMSIYIPSKYQKTGGAKKLADELIDMVEGLAKKSPDKFAIARTPDEIVANHKAGKVSLALGIENGAAIEGKLENLKHFYDRGVRYITLTHAKDNLICDSSYDDTRTHKGLSEFGKKVVAEMNRLGIMVDISHVSDDAFNQTIEQTKVPVIASHSSARHFVPGFERNMSDEMIKTLAKNGGVMMINFGSTFVDNGSRTSINKRREAIKKYAADNKLENDSPEVKKFAKEYAAKHPFPFAGIDSVVDHIDHVVQLVGVDHVGFGSDYDGVGDTLPTDLKDVAAYPVLFEKLLDRGYSEADIEKMSSGNVFRVWRAVQAHAANAGKAGKAGK